MKIPTHSHIASKGWESHKEQISGMGRLGKYPQRAYGGAAVPVQHFWIHGWDGLAWHGMGRHGMAWDGMHGMGWHGTGTPAGHSHAVPRGGGSC